MNAERLLAHYDRIADAPDAVPRLRRFILDLAVRGRLVEQDPDDEPASELLKRIAAEKARFVKAGGRNKNGSEPLPIAGVPFDLPTSWKWTALGELFMYDAGIKREPKSLDKTLWLLELEDIEKDSGRLLVRVTASERDSRSTKSEFRADDVLYGKLRPYLNKVLVADRPGYSTTEIVAIRPYLPLCSRYCALALRRPDFVDYVTRLGQGTKMPRLRTEDAKIAPFPLPPLAEQHRIVAKVDELTALCNQLEAVRTEREATRDRLAAASLSRLDAPDPDPTIFRHHAAAVLDNLTPLTTHSDQIRALRQTILNLAVRGRLVEQDPNEEPAPELLKRITAEKARLVRTGRMRMNAPARGIARDCPFEVPSGWTWTTLGEVCSKTGSGSTPRGGATAYRSSGVVFLRSQNIYDDGLRLKDVVYIDSTTHRRMSATAVREADLLLNITGGSIGRCCLVSDELGEANVSQHVAIIRVAIDGLQGYMHWLIRSPYFQTRVFEEQTGAGRGGLPKYKMDRMPIPLPPIDEQHRIVATIEKLTAIFDRLEARLKLTEDTQQEAAEALPHDALKMPVS